MSPGGQSDKDQKQRLYNLTLATVAGQAGCLTLVIVFAALIAGLWLDSQFHTRPLFIIILMATSVPVTIVVMVWVVTAATARIKPGAAGEDHTHKEDANGGANP